MMFIYNILSDIRFIYSSNFLFLITFFTGVIFIILGMINKNSITKDLKNNNLDYNIFRDRDALSKERGYVDNYPWEDIQVNSKLVTFYNNPRSGFGKNIGFTPLEI